MLFISNIHYRSLREFTDKFINLLSLHTVSGSSELNIRENEGNYTSAILIPKSATLYHVCITSTKYLYFLTCHWTTNQANTLYQRKHFSKFCGYRRSTSGSEEPLEIMIGFMLFFLLSPSWKVCFFVWANLNHAYPRIPRLLFKFLLLFRFRFWC